MATAGEPPLIARRRFYRIGLIAVLVETSVGTVKKWIKSGKLRAYALPDSTHCRVSHEDIVAFITRHPGQFGLDLDRIFGPGWDQPDDSWAQAFSVATEADDDESTGDDDNDGKAYLPDRKEIEAATAERREVHLTEMKSKGHSKTAMGLHPWQLSYKRKQGRERA